MTRRTVQFCLGLLWLLDGLLQLQPFMFTSGFARQVLAPTATGQPAIVADAVRWGAGLVAAHPVPWNLMFAATQLALGWCLVRGLRRGVQWTKAALAASIAWAFVVWYLGEGLGGLAAGRGSLLMGAPGAVVLYAALAWAVWPRQQDAVPGRPARWSNAIPGWVALVWAAIWLLGAELLLLPPQRGASGLSADLNGMAPSWLTSSIARAGTPGLLALAVVFIAVGLAALGPARWRLWSAGAGGVLAIALWWITQDFGQLSSGRATDPNSGPLLLLLAGALAGIPAGASVWAAMATGARGAPNATQVADPRGTSIDPTRSGPSGVGDERPLRSVVLSRSVLSRSVLACVLLVVAGCAISAPPSRPPRPAAPRRLGRRDGDGRQLGDIAPDPSPAQQAAAIPVGTGVSSVTSASSPLPGMPPLLVPDNVDAADGPGMMSPVVAADPERVYVPNSLSNTVTVIDPNTYKVLETVPVGREPQHVVPSYDLQTLWVNNDLGNSLTPINPRTGAFGKPVYVHDPYNLYFTPDGKYAVVMASNDRELVFRDAHTMAIHKVVHVPCAGVNHADFSANGRYFIVSCEFSAQLLKVDTEREIVLGSLRLPGGGMPQDVKLAPDGHTFYVADMDRNGIWLVNGDTLRITRFIHTGRGAHGEYISRNSEIMYISNRGEGSISLLNVKTDQLVGKWWIPGGGSPDMGGLSPDGKVLWISGRYNSVVYAISTVTGKLLAKIPVGAGPHGLCIFPQPGRYSLGHTGVYR